MAGFERGRRLEKMGMHAQDTAELFFTDVACRRRTCSARRATASSASIDNLPQERVSIAVAGVAAAEAALSLTIDYVQRAHRVRKPLGALAEHRFALAELRTEIDIAQVVRRPLRRRRSTTAS